MAETTFDAERKQYANDDLSSAMEETTPSATRPADALAQLIESIALTHRALSLTQEHLDALKETLA